MVAGLVSACLMYFFRSVARRINNTFNPIKSFIVICFARCVFILRETLPIGSNGSRLFHQPVHPYCTSPPLYESFDSPQQHHFRTSASPHHHHFERTEPRTPHPFPSELHYQGYKNYAIYEATPAIFCVRTARQQILLGRYSISGFRPQRLARHDFLPKN